MTLCPSMSWADPTLPSGLNWRTCDFTFFDQSGQAWCGYATLPTSPVVQPPLPPTPVVPIFTSDTLKASSVLPEMNGRFNAGGLAFSCPVSAAKCYVVASADTGGSYLTNAPLDATSVQQPIAPGTVNPAVRVPTGQPICLMAYAVDSVGAVLGRTDGVCIY